jgi:hypothetical protein
MSWRGMLGHWRGGGGGFFYSDGVGPFGDIGVSFFHRHPGILHEHLRAFAAAPGEITQEMGSTDAMGASWGIDLGLAALNHTGQIVHSILPTTIHSMQNGRVDYQP